MERPRQPAKVRNDEKSGNSLLKQKKGDAIIARLYYGFRSAAEEPKGEDIARK